MPYYRHSRFRSPRRRSGGFFDIRRRMRSVDWSAYSLTKFEKKFYDERSSVRDRSRRDVEEFRSKNKVTVLGHNVLRPIFKYSEAGFPNYIFTVIKKKNWGSPTPVQSQSLPVVLSGRDLVGITLDNAGKIEAYILPAIVHAKAQPSIKHGEGPIAIILVPSKEIVQKIEKVGEDFKSSAGIRFAYLYGGSSRTSQIEQLERTPEIVISTPGRVLDFIESRHTNLRRCTYLVLDEADRMLDMGYESSIRRIASQVRPDRQALMWSATWPREVKALAEDFLFDYIQMNMGSTKLVINRNIRQYVEVIDESEKFKRLTSLLNSLNSGILIFAESKRKTDDLCEKLQNKNYDASVIQGDMTQKERDRTLDAFSAGRTFMIVTTDFASKSLDIGNVRYVINYDYPAQIDDYVHRIDKSGKHDKGTSYTFFTSKQTRVARELVDVLKEARQKVPDDLSRIAQGRSNDNKRFKERSWRRYKSISRSRSTSKHSSSASRRSRSNLSGSRSRSASVVPTDDREVSNGCSRNGKNIAKKRSKSTSHKRDGSYNSKRSNKNRTSSRSTSRNSRHDSYRDKGSDRLRLSSEHSSRGRSKTRSRSQSSHSSPNEKVSYQSNKDNGSPHSDSSRERSISARRLRSTSSSSHSARSRSNRSIDSNKRSDGHTSPKIKSRSPTKSPEHITQNNVRSSAEKKSGSRQQNNRTSPLDEPSKKNRSEASLSHRDSSKSPSIKKSHNCVNNDSQKRVSRFHLNSRGNISKSDKTDRYESVKSSDRSRSRSTSRQRSCSDSGSEDDRISNRRK